MRIEAKSTLGGYPVLQVRKLLRARALEASGLAKIRPGKGPKAWTTTQLAQSFASASAAKPITRKTAETALSRLLERIDRVNHDNYFLAKVMRVIVFGSYLHADVDRLGDVDVAVELTPKESDRQCLRELNYRRVAVSEKKGRRFSGMLDREMWWRLETFHFLKGQKPFDQPA